MAEADRLKWNDRYRARATQNEQPDGLLIALDDLLPRQGRAIDVAGGAGRNALLLVRRGLDVTLADISDAALKIANEQAVAAGLTLRTVAVDLEAEPFPAGPWDLILCVDYLWRPLFGEFPRVLAPGGLLVVRHPTVSNLQRHDRPGPQYLLEDRELPDLVPDLEILRYEEGWQEGRHDARLFARRTHSRDESLCLADQDR